jgi:rhodanese-related sulfurtransferase
MLLKNRNQFLILAISLFSFLVLGCASTQKKAADQTPKADTSWKYSNIVDINFVKPLVKIPMAKNVMIIDSRPKRSMYDKGHIPMSVSIPKSSFQKMTDKLPTDKNALLVFYCGGFKCKLSHQSAFMAEKLGYTNIKVYAAGYPDWLKMAGNYGAVSEVYMKSKIDKNADMVIVDSRPKRTMYDKGHLPNALSIPNSQFDKFKSQLPTDKNKELIFYCGGFKCKLSHKSAAKAIAMGHTNVKVFAAGYPAWVKIAGKTKSAVKAGGEEGSIDIAYFEQTVKNNPDQLLIIDVRDPDEYAAGTFPNAINIPTDQLEAKIASLSMDKPIVFVCATGARSGEAYYMVQDLRPEMKNVFYLEAETDYLGSGKFKIIPVS